MLGKLNTKRLALSIGIVGAMVVPIGSGSLARFVGTQWTRPYGRRKRVMSMTR